MDDVTADFCLGIFVLALSLILWRETHNFWGWLALASGGRTISLRAG